MSLFDRAQNGPGPDISPRRQHLNDDEAEQYRTAAKEARASFDVPNFTGAPMEEKSRSGQADILVHAVICLVVGLAIGGAMHEILLPLHKGNVKNLWVAFFYVGAFYKMVGFWPAVLAAPAFGAFASFCYICKFLVTRYQ